MVMRSTLILRFCRLGAAALLLLPFLLGVMARPAGAVETSIRMESDPGDPIGMGAAYQITDADGFFTLTGNPDGVTLLFEPLGGGDVWTFDFDAQPGASLVAGETFSPVFDAQASAGLPAMNVAGGNRNCDWVTGSFHVHDVSFDALGNPTSLWATFEQHCDGGAPALRGDIRVNADVVVNVQAPWTQFVN